MTMDLTGIQALCDQFAADSPWNDVSPEEAISPELYMCGIQIFSRKTAR